MGNCTEIPYEGISFRSAARPFNKQVQLSITSDGECRIADNMSTFTPAKRIFLKNHPDYSENWVQDIIAHDPAILGLGDLILLGRERIQPTAGRLDILLKDRDNDKRYEIELQLGPTDPSHIIRTIEYWDIERKRYPQYDHCAVLVAEDITSRFLNVVSLFNGSMPIIAVQMQAFEVGNEITLIFTKVLDEMQRGLVDEDAISAPTDRPYWEKRATNKTIALMDRMFEVVRKDDSNCELNYNKFYIGLLKNGRANNYVIFRPNKSFLIFEARLQRSEDVDARLDNAALTTLEYNARWGTYRIRVTDKDFKEHEHLFQDLINEARKQREAD